MELYTASAYGPLEDLLPAILPYLGWESGKKILVLLALYWLLRRLLLKDGWFSTLGATLFGARFHEAQLQREARKAERAGDWSSAAHIHEELGDLNRALDCFERSEEYNPANRAENPTRLCGATIGQTEWRMVQFGAIRSPQKVVRFTNLDTKNRLSMTVITRGVPERRRSWILL